MTKGIKVIITDVESRKAFDVVNIMQRYYKYDCILCSGKHTQYRLSLIYGTKVYKLRKNRADVFNDDLTEILKEFDNHKLVYLPVSEDTTALFYKYVASHTSSQLLYKLPTEEYFKMTGDKGRFQTYCESKKFPVPRKYEVEDLEYLRKNFRPLILKPHFGQGSVGIRYFHQPEELDTLKESDLKENILQDKVIGSQKVIGAFFLYDKGKIINAYTHQRLRTFPTKGGVTVYSKSTYNEEVIKIGSELLNDLNWNGLAMIEFMYDEPSQEWKIIELNPRIWGSILLSAFNNSAFLDDYVRLCLKEEIQNNKVLKQVYIRWFFPFEWLNLFKGNISLKEFFTMERDKTCYINFTYSNWLSAFCYQVYFLINKKSITRFFKKIF